MNKKELFFNLIENMISDLFYYHWKNNDDMTPEDVNNLIKSGQITKQEILKKINNILDNIEGLQ